MGKYVNKLNYREIAKRAMNPFSIFYDRTQMVFCKATEVFLFVVFLGQSNTLSLSFFICTL